MSKHKTGELVSNRKAFYEYEILETWESGLVLLGTEVKSLRNHGGNLQDAYILAKPQGAILKNASIAVYRFGNLHNHEEKRDRPLLLHKRELLQLVHASQEKGLTLIPLALYLHNGWVKVKIGVAKGKKLHDKRQSVKEKEQKKEIQRSLKYDNSI